MFNNFYDFFQRKWIPNWNWLCENIWEFFEYVFVFECLVLFQIKVFNFCIEMWNEFLFHEYALPHRMNIFFITTTTKNNCEKKHSQTTYFVDNIHAVVIYTTHYHSFFVGQNKISRRNKFASICVATIHRIIAALRNNFIMFAKRLFASIRRNNFLDCTVQKCFPT